MSTQLIPIDDKLPKGSWSLGLVLVLSHLFPFQSAQAAPAPCGNLVYNKATEQGTFLWQDCPAGAWHLRVTAGGASGSSYTGSLDSTRAFSSISGFSIENGDLLDVSGAGQVTYRLNVGNVGEDGIDFTQAANATTCVDTGAPVRVGPNRTLVQSPFDLGTLGACGGTASPGHAYLNDADTTDSIRFSSSSDLGNRPFPRITTGPLKLSGTAQQLSKYSVIAAKAHRFTLMAQVQAINPEIRALRVHCPQEYQGFEDNDACRTGNGMPFGGTGPATTGCNVYAGHWLYAPGTTLRSAIAANATSVQVDDPSQFIVGRYAVIYDGAPGAFLNAEHVRVTAVNAQTRTLTLANRGYKSTARTHPASAIIAEHVVGNGTTGSDVNPENWVYNQSTTCPKDSSGRQINEIMAEWLATNYTKDPSGKAANVRLEGILFDSDFNFIKDSGHNKRPDVDNDLALDDGFSRTGENLWGNGMEAFYNALRERLPDAVLIGGVPESRGYDGLNGTQFEGWPQRNIGSSSPDYREIGGRLSNYSVQMHHGIHGPRYSEGYNRMSTRLYPYGSVVATSNAPFRFSFGLILLEDGYYGQQNSYVTDPWWDEYAVDVVRGSPTFGQAIASNPRNETLARQHTGWLGFPLGSRYRVYDLATFAPDRDLMPSGTFDSQLGDWRSDNVSIRLDTTASNRIEGTGALSISKPLNYEHSDVTASVSSPTVQLTGGVAYTLAFAAKSDEIRSIQIAVGNTSETYYLPATWSRQVITFTPPSTGSYRVKFNVGKYDSPLWLDAIYLFRGNADVFRRDFDHGVVVVNATDSQQTVDLAGTFQRIRGTGQDSINNGATISAVTIAPYDSAILIRP